jgi:hypothetical protein
VISEERHSILSSLQNSRCESRSCVPSCRSRPDGTAWFIFNVFFTQRFCSRLQLCSAISSATSAQATASSADALSVLDRPLSMHRIGAMSHTLTDLRSGCSLDREARDVEAYGRRQSTRRWKSRALYHNLEHRFVKRISNVRSKGYMSFKNLSMRNRRRRVSRPQWENGCATF